MMRFKLMPLAVLAVATCAFAHQEPDGMQMSTKSPEAHRYFEQGMAKMEMLHIQDGLNNFRKSVAADPQFALGHIILNFFSQDPTEQVAERQKALATRQFAGPEEKLVIDWLANASESHWIPAIQAMNQALDTYPRDKHLAWLAGWWLALNQNQSPRAVHQFERVIQIDPHFADAWNEAAYCYAKAGNFDKAFADMKRYTELVPNEPNPQDSFAEISRMAGRFDQAITHYRASLKIDPTFHESQLGLGDTYALMGDEARARAEYAIAINEGTEVQKVVWGLQWAATYVRENDLAGAEKAFHTVAERAHEKDFGNYEAEAYRSLAMYEKDSGTAMKLLDKAESVLHEHHNVPKVLLDEELALVWRSRVERALGEGNHKLAASTLKQLDDMAAATPDEMIQAAHHGAAGEVFLSEGKYGAAISHLEEDDTNPLSMRNLVMAYEKSGQKENADKLAEKLAVFYFPTIEQALVVPQFRAAYKTTPKGNHKLESVAEKSR
jgi:tetratricopeptide (TPR) repeat protein